MGTGRDNYDSRVSDNLVTCEKWPDGDEERHVPGDLTRTHRHPEAEADLCWQSAQRGGQSEGREEMS